MSATRWPRPGVLAVFTGADIDVGPMPPVLPRFDPALSLPLLARRRRALRRRAGRGRRRRHGGARRRRGRAGRGRATTPLPTGVPCSEHLDDDVAETLRGRRRRRRPVRRLRRGRHALADAPAHGGLPARDPCRRVGVGRRRPAPPLAQRAGAARGEDGAAGGLRARAHDGARDRARRRRRVRAEVRQLSRRRRHGVGRAPHRARRPVDRDPQREHGRAAPRPWAGADA